MLGPCGNKVRHDVSSQPGNALIPVQRRRTRPFTTLKVYEFNRQSARIDNEATGRDGKREAARASAPRIDIQDPVLPSKSRFVGVAMDDRMKSSRGGIKIERFEVMEHIKENRTGHLQQVCCRYRISPNSLVDVAADDGDRRQALQFGHDLWFADVTRMQNEITAP